MANKNLFIFPAISKNRGVGYWIKPHNLFAARRKLRRDFSNEWRTAFESQMDRLNVGKNAYSRSVLFSSLVPQPKKYDSIRIALLADTGDGDRSQYGLLPLLRFVKPDALILNGDIAYPAGRLKDYEEGFFKPYNDLRIPIWAVPGNHEYYSSNHGREFFEIFCTNDHQGLWDQYGLRFIRQPGSYWELADAKITPLVIIGIDSGKSGDLDGERRKHPRERTQMTWLEWRLSEADRNRQKVILLFHIPGLVDGEANSEAHLNGLHEIISRHPSIRLVTCGHVHNYQRYDSKTFGAYLARTGAVSVHASPDYIVCGGGGAFLSGTAFKGQFPTLDRYPASKEWKSYASMARRVVGRSILGRLFSSVGEAWALDADVSDYLSFLLIDIPLDHSSPTVTPVFQDSLDKLYKVPSGTRISVMNGYPPIDAAAATDAIKNDRAIKL